MSDGVSLADLERFDTESRIVLLNEMRAVRARRRLEFITDLRVGSGVVGKDGAKEHMTAIIQVAFDRDDYRFAHWMHAVHQ